MELWPNFFIVGAPKAGTSSIYANLYKHREIYMSPIKEPNYFSSATFPDEHPIKPIRDKEKYLKLFEKAKSKKIIGEATPTYLEDPKAAELIHQISPNAKILISLRDPIERLFSNYLMSQRYGTIKSSFHDALLKSINHQEDKNSDLRLERGLYSESVKRYIDTFGKDQIKIIIFEEFIKDEQTTTIEILKFLGVSYESFYLKTEIYNPYVVVRGPVSSMILKNRTIKRISELVFSPLQRKFLKEKLIVRKQKKPTMDEKDIALLRNFYSENVKKLEAILNRTVPWSNFQN